MKFYSPYHYQKSCEDMFNLYQPLFAKSLPTARMEHVGASSIAGAISKGDLDIYVEVTLDEMDNATKKLLELGFVEKKDTLRTLELCMLEAGNGDDIAVQLVAKDSEFEFFLHFRDALNDHKTLVEQYNQLKSKFEGKSQASYRTAKSQFIEQVLMCRRI
ncbi:MULTISPECIES: GrpB family protein [Vibrio]|uniref:GrpB family protein n=1 Tax=Vibrio TaxID=662 RepID=UPI000D38B0DC|nr:MULTISPECIES: GrpB family protein [Vibrio]PTP58000.1 hypothetical protein CWN83_01650 [Vibrio splendidus]UPR31297.1 GrpB family protein [Vibrio crassostreae]